MSESPSPARPPDAAALAAAIASVNRGITRFSLRSGSDHAGVAREATVLIGATDLMRRIVASRRREAVGELRARGWSHREVADATGLTVARAAQIAREAVAAKAKTVRHADGEPRKRPGDGFDV